LLMLFVTCHVERSETSLDVGQTVASKEMI
jgi:hypothetical protein